jgi:hypothetical protein
MTIGGIRTIALVLAILLLIIQHVLTLMEDNDKKLENRKLSSRIEGIEHGVNLLLSQGKITKQVALTILHTILWKVTVFDEDNHPVEGASINILKEINNSFTELAHALSEAGGETSLVTTDFSGAKFHTAIQKAGYETYSRPLESSLVRVHLRRQS